MPAVTSAPVIDGPTIAHTAAMLAAGPGAGGDDGDVIQAVRRNEPGGDPDELDELDALSDDEVEARLRELLAEDEETR